MKKKMTKALLIEHDVKEFGWIEKEKQEYLKVINKFVTRMRYIKNNDGISVYNQFSDGISSLVHIIKIILPYILLWKKDINLEYNGLNIKLFYSGKNSIASLIANYWEHMVDPDAYLKVSDVKESFSDLYLEFQQVLLNKLKEKGWLSYVNVDWMVRWYYCEDDVSELEIWGINDWIEVLCAAKDSFSMWMDDVIWNDNYHLSENDEDIIDNFFDILNKNNSIQ